MKKDNIFNVALICCGLLIVLSVFLPYISMYSTAFSLWEMEDSSRYIYIILGILVFVLYLFNKKIELSYITFGYCTFASISNIIANGGLKGFSLGFYLIFLSSITIGVLTFLYNEENSIAIIGTDEEELH